MDPCTLRFPLAVLALALLPLLGWACSPPEGPYVPPGIETKIHFSDVVVYGEVTQRMDNKDFPESAYSVVMKVHCIFKTDDENFPSEITIVNAGHMPGLCHSTDLAVGEEYIVYLGKVGDKFEPRFSETKATSQALQDFSFYCDVDIIYPDDYEENNKCPPAYPDYEDCIAYKPPTEATPIMPPLPTKPSAPVAEPTHRVEAVASKTTPKTEVRIVSNGNTMSDDQGHSVLTQHGPAKEEDEDEGEGDPQESVDSERYGRPDNGSNAPLLSTLLGAACLLVALLARA